MTHPLIPKILELATPIAESLGLEVVTAVFHTNQSPPILRVDIRNRDHDTSLNDCERMSLALESTLDESNLIPDAYVLEVSSPGIPQQLTSDREFVSFKGFPIKIETAPSYEGHKEWIGQLIRRDENAVYLNKKGRSIAIPRSFIVKVELDEGQEI